MKKDNSFNDLMRMPEDADTIIGVEIAVIGGALAENLLRLPPLRADMFFLDKHQVIWAGILDLIEKDGHADVVTLSQHLRLKGTFDTAGGPAKLAELLEQGATATNLMSYARQIQESATRREMKRLASDMLAEGMTRQNVLTRLDEMPGPYTGAPYDPITNWHRIVERWAKGMQIPTGLKELDAKTQGLALGDMIVIAGRTSHGKTAFSKSLMLRLAQAGHASDYLTLEETDDSITRRFVSELSSIPNYKIKFGPPLLSEDEITACEQAVGKLQDLPIRVTALDTMRTLDEDAICGMVAGAESKIVFVDHLQKIVTKGDSRQYGLERALNRLHAIGIRQGKAVIILSQLGRLMEKENRPPILSDMRDTGALEMAPRQVWLLYWPWKADPTKPDHPQNLYRIDVAKNSDGETGLIQVDFYAPCGQFVSWGTDPGGAASVTTAEEVVPF